MKGWLSRFLRRKSTSGKIEVSKVICGLGNPGPRYQNTRHNVGYQVVARIAKDRGVCWENYRGLAEIAVTDFGGEKVLLARPLTFMNLSGKAVLPLVKDTGISLSDLLVVYDDMDLPLGTIRARARGSSGGHRGVQSVIDHLGSSDFPRIRIGIGRPPAGVDAATYVLSPFQQEEEELLEEVLEKAVAAAAIWVEKGIDVVMNQFNRKKE
ncbi:MAG: Peptidyl-tRNA hydrolase [Thermoanaerobacterales bacterium 50_218]|nr:MAG: Peptidyl-tRNA hydrolase [Thermoanaerobacterales bacterium 50_218]